MAINRPIEGTSKFCETSGNNGVRILERPVLKELSKSYVDILRIRFSGWVSFEIFLPIGRSAVCVAVWRVSFIVQPSQRIIVICYDEYVYKL